MAGENKAVAGISCGHHAVKKVNSARDRLNYIAGRADSHQVARSVLGRVGQGDVQNPVHLLGCLAHRESAYRVPRQVELGDFLHMPDSDVLVRAALVDAEKQLVFVDCAVRRIKARHLVAAAAEPAQRPLARRLDVLVRGGVFDTFVERHCDRRREVRLYAHTLLRPHKNPPPVDVRREAHALLGDFAQLGERKHLKTAAVGQNRSVPVHKFVQPAHIAHHLVAGTQVQMVGVGKLNLAADFL